VETVVTGFPHILEILENSTFIFQVLEMSLNLTKSGNIFEKILPLKKSTYNQNPVNKYYVWRRKL